MAVLVDSTVWIDFFNGLDNHRVALLTSFLDAEGDELQRVTVTIPANGHLARFPEEMFSEMIPEPFEGTVLVESELPVLVASLRTRDGLQASSYPRPVARHPMLRGSSTTPCNQISHIGHPARVRRMRAGNRNENRVAGGYPRGKLRPALFSKSLNVLCFPHGQG